MPLKIIQSACVPLRPHVDTVFHKGPTWDPCVKFAQPRSIQVYFMFGHLMLWKKIQPILVPCWPDVGKTSQCGTHIGPMSQFRTRRIFYSFFVCNNKRAIVLEYRENYRFWLNLFNF